MRMNSPHVKSLVLVLITSVIPSILFGQNLITGTVTSVPSKSTPDTVKITFTNTSTGNKYSQRTLNGQFTINLPSGTYQRKVEATGNYLVLDTMVINASQTVSEKLIKNKAMTSQMYLNWNLSLLWFLKVLTSTYEGNGRGTTTLSRERNPPLRLFANRDSMPSGLGVYLDNTIIDYTSKTDSIITYRECTTDSIVGISLRYRNSFQYPFSIYGSLGWTDMDMNHPVCYFNTDYINSANAQQAFLREMYRALYMFTYSGDPSMVSYYVSNGVLGLHPDEAEVIERVFTLDNGTDMRKHRDTVITSISNVLPIGFTFTNSNNPSFINNNLEITHSTMSDRDGDGEKNTIWLKLIGNGLDTVMTTENVNDTLFVNSSKLLPDSTYLLEGAVISGFDTVKVPSMNIVTPIDSLVPFTFTEPLDSSTVTYKSKQLEIDYTPYQITDSYGKTITDYIHVSGPGLDTTIITRGIGKVYWDSSRLLLDTLYIIAGKRTNGVDTVSATDTIHFRTPKSPPPPYTPPVPFTFTSPLDGSTIVYVNKKLEIDYSPYSSIAPDGKTVDDMINVKGYGLDTIIITRGIGKVYLDSSRLQLDTPYIIDGKRTDGTDTVSATNIIHFRTPKPLGINDINVINIEYFPNPVTGHLTIRGDVTGKISISLIDISGKELFNSIAYPNGTLSQDIDMSKYNRGLYFIRLKTDQNLKVFKIIK